MFFFQIAIPTWPKPFHHSILGLFTSSDPPVLPGTYVLATALQVVMAQHRRNMEMVQAPKLTLQKT